jgi:hypothetical protein
VSSWRIFSRFWCIFSSQNRLDSPSIYGPIRSIFGNRDDWAVSDLSQRFSHDLGCCCGGYNLIQPSSPVPFRSVLGPERTINGDQGIFPSKISGFCKGWGRSGLRRDTLLLERGSAAE